MTNFQQIIQYGELILKILLHFFVALLNPFESNNTIGSINLFKLSLKFPATTVTALNLKFLCFTLHSISWNGIGIRFNIQNRKLILELDGCQVHIDTLGEDPNITAPSSHRQLVSSHQVPKKKSNGLLGYLTKLINFLQPSIELKISNSNEISLVNNSSTGAAVNIALHDVSVEVSAKGHTLNVSSHITAKKISVAMGDTQDANLFALELCALDVSVKNLYMLPLQSASATEALGVTASLGLVRSQLHSNSCPALLQSVSVLMNNFKSHEDIKRTTARNWTQFCKRYDYVDTSVQNTSEESPPVSSASISESMTTSIDSYERPKVSLQFHVSVNISVISFVCDTRVSTESESRLVEVIRLQCIQSTVEVSESGTTVDFSVQSLLTCQTPSTLPTLPIPPVALLSSSSLSDSWLSIKLLQSASIRNLVCTVQRTAIAVDVSVLSQLLYFAKDLSCLLGSYQSSEKRFARVMQTMSSPSQPVANSSTASSTSVKQEVSVTAGDVSVSLVDYFKLFRDASVVTIPVDSGLPLLALELIGVSISHTHIASDSDHAQTSLVSERIDDDEYFESKVDPEYNLLHGSTWTIQVSAVEVVLEHSSLVSKSIAISSVSVTLSSYTYTCQVSEGPEIQIPDFAELSTDYVLNWMRTFQSTKAFISLQNIAVGSVIIKLCQSDIIRLAFINSVINACSSTTAARNHIYKMLPLKVYPTYKSQFRRDYQKITALSVHIGHINASYLLEVTDRSSRTLPLLNINGLLVERVALNGMMSVMEVATGCDIEVECSDTRHDAIMYPAVFRLKAQFKKATDVRMISLLESFPIMGQHQRSVGSNKNLATHSLHVILQQVVFIHSVCQLDDAIACIGHVSSRLLIESEKLELCMENSTSTGVCNLIGAINKMGHDIGLYCRKELMNSFVTEDLSYIGKLPHVQYMYTNQLSPMLQQPSSLLVFRGRHIEIILGNENATVLHLPISDIAFTMTGFGGHISQMSGTVAGLEIVEVSQKLSLHPQFLSTFEVNGPIKNRLDFHLSTRRGAAPLLEVVIENARVIYLQRALATLISYFKDHLIPTAVRSVREGYASSRAQLLHQCNYNTAIASDHSDLDSAVSTIGQEYVKLFPKSAFRVGGLIKNVEAHFPANSCGGDSLALISPSLSLYMGRLDNETEIAYCKGPHLVKQVWMSDLDHVLDLMQPTFGIVSVLSGHRPSQTQRSVISSVSVPYSWQIRKHVDELIAPPHLSTHVGVKFRAQLENATLATWCSRSAFGTNMKVDILVSVVPIMPFTREVLGDDETDYVFGKEPIVIPPGPRNIVTIGLDIDKIDWVITQGQYHTLVNMLTQSFGEFQCNVKDMFVPPIPKKVKLSDDLYGRESPDEVLPLVTSVPVNFGAGRLFAVENEPEYYDLSSRLSRLHSEFKATGDSVPTWSCHHAHRRQLFTRTYPFSTSIEKEIKETKAKETKDSKSRSSLSGRSDPASKNRASVLRTQIGIRASNALNLGQIDPRAAIFETNKPLFCVYFDFIKLHFFRRHFGGGNGLDVYGYRFVVTEPILPDSLPSNSIEAYLDISLIPAEKIIAAPKDLPQVNPDMKQSFSTDIFAKMKSLRRMNSTKDGDDDPTVPARERSYNVAYHQQGISNLRRCVVNVTDSVIVVHMSAIFDMISFFMEPIRVNYLRSLSVLARSGLGILDFKANMDLEVHVKDSSFCLPRPTEEEGMSAICLAGDASYTQAWRGFLTAGPGRRPSSISVDVKSIFIAPIHDLRVTGVDSLIDPCEAHFAMDLCVVSDDATVESKLQALRPFMTLPSQEGKLNPTDRAVAYTSRSMKLFPTGKEHLLDLKFKKDKLNRSIKSSSPEKDSISSRSVEDSVTSDVDSVELRFSLKDIAFIVDASVKLSKAIKSRGIRPAVTERYELQFYSFYDVEHLPPLTFYHPSAKFKEFWTVGDAQVEVHSTDLNFIVRNNTYSMKIAKLALSNFQFSRFLHNRENLHVVSSGTVSAWTFNDNVNVWEPVLESVTVNLIAATDATERFDKSSRRCVHFDIFSTPVDVTIAQNALLGLIRKLTLADVVTTTSVYIPPYKIINELGVPVHCKVSAGGADDEDGAQIDIPVGGHVPVDRLQLTRAHRKTDESMKKSTRKNDKSDDGMEHRIDISFTIDNESYMSKESIPFGMKSYHY